MYSPGTKEDSGTTWGQRSQSSVWILVFSQQPPVVQVNGLHLTSLVKPSFSHNTDFIHAGAEGCPGREGLQTNRRLYKLPDRVSESDLKLVGSDAWR